MQSWIQGYLWFGKKKVVKAVETEAKEDNAPLEAIKATSDATVEVVKSAALEVYDTASPFIILYFAFTLVKISVL